MLVDDFIKQLEEHKEKKLIIGTGWVDYKIVDVYDHKGKCVVHLGEDWGEGEEG